MVRKYQHIRGGVLVLINPSREERSALRLFARRIDIFRKICADSSDDNNAGLGMRADDVEGRLSCRGLWSEGEM